MSPLEENRLLHWPDLNCFIDEVELQTTATTHLTFCYFGLLVPSDKSEVENNAKEILSTLGEIKFHAHKTYRVPAHESVCEKLTNLIIEHKLQTLFFPFSKSWLGDPRLAVLKTFQLHDFPRVRNSNYRTQAWLMFIHVFNAYLMDNHPSKKVRAFFDSDWLRPGEVVLHEGQKLKAIAEMVSTNQKHTTLLCLADHVGYLFQKFKKISFSQDGKLMVGPILDEDYVTKNSVRLFQGLTENSLFTTLDLWKWIDKENQH